MEKHERKAEQQLGQSQAFVDDESPSKAETGEIVANLQARQEQRLTDQPAPERITTVLVSRRSELAMFLTDEGKKTSFGRLAIRQGVASNGTFAARLTPNSAWTTTHDPVFFRGVSGFRGDSHSSAILSGQFWEMSGPSPVEPMRNRTRYAAR